MACFSYFCHVVKAVMVPAGSPCWQSRVFSGEKSRSEPLRTSRRAEHQRKLKVNLLGSVRIKHESRESIVPPALCLVQPGFWTQTASRMDRTSQDGFWNICLMSRQNQDIIEVSSQIRLWALGDKTAKKGTWRHSQATFRWTWTLLVLISCVLMLHLTRKWLFSVGVVNHAGVCVALLYR